MKAVILAAGIGSRLRPITNEIPKCLVKVNGKSIIEYQIEAYEYAGIKDIIIVTGYLEDKLVDFINQKYKNLRITFVNNKDYNSTNNMYSLYLVKDLVNSEFIMSNADVVFSKDMVKALINNNGSFICVDKDNYNEESMKIIVEDEKVIAISKKIEKEQAYGTSIDLYKFNKISKEEIFKEIDYIINTKCDLNSWTEVAIDSILSRIEFKPFNIEDRFWYEIDNHQDLKIAENIVKEKNI